MRGKHCQITVSVLTLIDPSRPCLTQHTAHHRYSTASLGGQWSVVSGQEVMMCFVRCGTCLRCSWSVPSLASITGSVHSLLQTTISMEAPTRPSRFLHIDLL